MQDVILELLRPENLLLMMFAYGLGALPTSYMVARLMHGVDIKKQSSHAHTATYVWQSIKKSSGVLVFCLDLLKGLLPSAIAYSLDKMPFVIAVVGFFAVLGHCFSVWLRFSGGHGSITLAGCLLMIYWPASIAIFLMNILLFILRFNVGQASIIASCVGAVVLFLSIPNKMVCLMVIFCVGIIIFRHQKPMLV